MMEWNDGMVNMEWLIWNGQSFQNLPSFSCNTSLNVCKEWFRICSNKKPELCMKTQRIMGPFHVLEIL